jgi:hypothetical protein
MKVAFCTAVLLALAASWLSAAEVRVSQTPEGWRLLRDGKPYYVKGAVVLAGPESGRYLDELKRAGANSARVSATLLDALEQRGMTGFVGLPVGLIRRGFDYNDAKQTAKLEQDIRNTVTRYKDHPAVLLWTIGNEPNIGSSREQARRSYQEIERLAKVVKEIDPRHPVITVVGDGEMRRYLRDLDELCPSLDAIGLNAYRSIFFLPEEVAARGWKRPYLITEFGPTGHWQVIKTAWGMPVEETSTEKAAQYRAAYETVIAGDPQCLGSYVFLWHGDRHEKTHTWYNMFLPDGSRTGPVDVMQQLWTGKRPPNLAPRILAIQVDGRFAPPVLKAGGTAECEVSARDPDGDALHYEWELRPDVADDPKVGGDKEEPVAPIPGAFSSGGTRTARLQTPARAGPYRIFVYVRDGRGGAAMANRPIQVVAP